MRNLNSITSLEIIFHDLEVDMDFVKLCNNRRSVDTYRDYKYLGTRVRVDGTVGE